MWLHLNSARKARSKMARSTPLLGGAAPRQPNWRVRAAVAASMLLAAVALAALAVQTAPSVLLGSASAPASGEITVFMMRSTRN